MTVTIVLTSTVNVQLHKKYIYQNSSVERIEIYLKSIRQWLTQTNFNIVLIENSGYAFSELDNDLLEYSSRFEIIRFKEEEISDAEYLLDNWSKGSSEIFSINYAYSKSTFMQNSDFIIKITARYFIPDFESYLSNYDLNTYDCLTQNDINRCEIVGSHIRNFDCIFNKSLINKENMIINHIEDLWKERTSMYGNVLHCKEFPIEETKRGGLNETFSSL